MPGIKNLNLNLNLIFFKIPNKSGKKKSTLIFNLRFDKAFSDGNRTQQNSTKIRLQLTITFT
jgi:hypothetical protein